jgi:hypothetical protein
VSDQGLSGGGSTNGAFSATENQTPPSSGVVLQTRAATPSPENQIQQQTAVHNGSVTAADVSIFDQAGNPFTITNPLPVYVTSSVPVGTVETDLTFFGSASSVSSGIATTVVTYVVPVGFNFILVKCVFDGENIAVYDLTVNGSTVDRMHTYFGATLSGMFDFSASQSRGVKYPESTVFQVIVVHNRPSLANFSARLQGVLISI